jgi:hypothetical protein
MSGKAIGLWLPIAAFVAVGLEHSGTPQVTERTRPIDLPFTCPTPQSPAAQIKASLLPFLIIDLLMLMHMDGMMYQM